MVFATAAVLTDLRLVLVVRVHSRQSSAFPDVLSGETPTSLVWGLGIGFKDTSESRFRFALVGRPKAWCRNAFKTIGAMSFRTGSSALATLVRVEVIAARKLHLRSSEDEDFPSPYVIVQYNDKKKSTDVIQESCTPRWRVGSSNKVFSLYVARDTVSPIQKLYTYNHK
jgi:hypothetical protein